MSLKNNRESITNSYVWDIWNFTSLERLSDPGDFLQSPVFNSKSINKKWKFCIYPKGIHIEDYIGFYVGNISNMSFQSHIQYNCTLCIGRPNEAPVKSCKYTGVYFLRDAIGDGFFLLKKSNIWIFRGPVRFQCDITEVDQKNYDFRNGPFLESFVSKSNHMDTANLSLDLEKLSRVPFHSDLTVKISGSEIHIHKYILYSRCHNISDEFGYRTVMEMPPQVEIEIGVEIFERLMYYFYTGRLKDSYVPLELFRLAERLRLPSLRQCLHEQAYNYHVDSITEVEIQVISWNLDELGFLEEDLTCVHILQTKLYAEQLAIQVRVSDGCRNEKFIDVSFKFFEFEEHRPIFFTCKISLASPACLDAFKEEHHTFQEDDHWDFPRISCQKDKIYRYILGMCLTAELSMSDGSASRKLKYIRTKTKLYTDFQTVADNLENLYSSMRFLFEMAQPTSNLILLSVDNKFFRVHDGIMWARWPGLRRLIDVSSVSSNEDIDAAKQLELELPSVVLKLLLAYFYTGFINNFDRTKAEILLKYSSYLEYPYHLLEKCEAYLSRFS